MLASRPFKAESDRVKITSANDTEALEGFSLLSRLKGIVPALESSHVIFGASLVTKEVRSDWDVVILSQWEGR